MICAKNDNQHRSLNFLFVNYRIIFEKRLNLRVANLASQPVNALS